MSKTRFNISVPGEKYQSGDDEKQSWTNVGVAFQNEGGSISCKLNKNISVSGEFVLMLPKKKEA